MSIQPAKMVDISGQRFGRLRALRPTGKLRGRITWLCICDCGKEKIAIGSDLRSGMCSSCGCYQRETTIARSTKHGCSSHLFKSGTYRSWQSMMQRCLDPKARNYTDYGGRGISICDRWKVFTNFLADMGERPSGKSIDRFPNNDGNYEPGNCRWATSKEQASNRRKPRRRAA